MKRTLFAAALAALFWGVTAQADTVGDLLAQYAAAGGKDFSASYNFV